MILEDFSLQTLASREITVVVLNQTGDQLDLDAESGRLSLGKWEPAESLPPEIVPPGGSALWHCKSMGVGRGIDGSVTYKVSGGVPHDKVRFCWKNRYFGPNHYDTAATREGHVISVRGGMGANATVVFALQSVESQGPVREG